MQVRRLPWLYVSARRKVLSFTSSSSSSSKETSGLLENMGNDDDGDAANTDRD